VNKSVYVHSSLTVMRQVADLEQSMLGEDQRSTEKNISSMQAEMKKPQPDKAVVGDKMKRTVAHRQKMCLERPTNEVLEIFPCLTKYFFVSSNLLLYSINDKSD